MMDKIVTVDMAATFQYRLAYYTEAKGLARNPYWKPVAVVVEHKTREMLWRYPQPLRSIHCPRWDKLLY